MAMTIMRESKGSARALFYFWAVDAAYSAYMSFVNGDISVASVSVLFLIVSLFIAIKLDFILLQSKMMYLVFAYLVGNFLWLDLMGAFKDGGWTYAVTGALITLYLIINMYRLSREVLHPELVMPVKETSFQTTLVNLGILALFCILIGLVFWYTL